MNECKGEPMPAPVSVAILLTKYLWIIPLTFNLFFPPTIIDALHPHAILIQGV